MLQWLLNSLQSCFAVVAGSVLFQLINVTSLFLNCYIIIITQSTLLSIIMKQQGFFQDETVQHVEDIKNVVIRIRPLTAKQMAINRNETVQVMDGKVIALLDQQNQQTERKGRSRQAQFSFDFVFDKNASTKQIYDQSISNLLEGVLDGFNSTVLAYGPTGCGKTFTMIGEAGKEGITALTMIDLLGRAKELRTYKNIIIRLSYIQIYNQNIKDLLISQDKTLDLRQDPKEGICIPGVTEIVINSMLELATVLKVGAANRSKQATSSNQISSRSHSILLVKTQTRDKASGIKEQVSIGRLSLVDLAGSERAGGQKGARQIEGAKINKSLLALGNCIQVLGQSSGKSVFVPYRQSKLTRLLKQSLGGNCRTAMIVNVTPFTYNWQQTHNTLVYANRAKNIKTSASRNVLASEAHLSNYIALIGNLKRQNQELKNQLRGNKNYSLPQLKSVSLVNAQQIQIQRIQNLINAHFGQENKLLNAISEISMKIDKAGFKLFRLKLEKKKQSLGKERKSHKNSKDQSGVTLLLQDLSQQKLGFQAKLEDLILERGSLVEQIKSSDIAQNGISMLMTQYRQKKIQIELQEIRLREVRLQAEKIQKQILVKALGQQLNIRDKIIQEQKIIIQKNNIINRITYSKLNAANQVLPELFQKINQAVKPVKIDSKQQQLFFQQKPPNQSRNDEASLHKQSAMTKKKKNLIPKNKSLVEPNSVDASWQRLRHMDSQFEYGAKQKKDLGLKSKHKIQRQVSKKKKQNPQLNFVYLQR